jgi:hypothetical protein
MPALARADLEHLLQTRKLGLTLPPAGTLTPRDPGRVAATGLASLDTHVAGWPRGHMSEIAGPLSAGATWIACNSLAAATRRGELAAWIDPLDMLDPESVATTGCVWSHVLWVRGSAGGARHHAPRTPPRARRTPDAAPGARHLALSALKALSLVLQAEGFGLVVLDFQGVPAAVVKQLPFTTWRRVHRLVEGRETACLVLHGEPIARSAGGVTLALDTPRSTGPGAWAGSSRHARRLVGLTAHARVICAEWQRTALDGFEWDSNSSRASSTSTDRP